jgi:hypothetical protein
MIRRYITGWFSPADHELMVQLYETDGSSGTSFEAESLKKGSVIRTMRDNSLIILQSDILERYGGRVHDLTHASRTRASIQSSGPGVQRKVMDGEKKRGKKPL